MKPIKTINTNSVLRAPEGIENVDDLPITKLEFSDGLHAIESCWKLSESELDEVKRTGRVYFLALGDIHPPILLSTKSHVESDEKGDIEKC